MARAGVDTLVSVNNTATGIVVASGRRQWLSWSYEPIGNVTGGVNLQLKARLTEDGLWFDVGAPRTLVAGELIIGNIPVPMFQSRVDQAGAITGGGSIRATIMYG